MTKSTHESEDEARYGSFETVEGETVLYDRENPDAWIQSNYSVEVSGADPGTATDAETAD